MNSEQYWAEREAEALKRRITDEKEYDKQIKQIYQDMLDGCQKEIDSFYGKYAAKEGITIAEAKKRVSQLDIKAYERKAKKYVKEKDFSKQANEEMRLYNATMKINRLEMLKANIGLELIAGHDELEKFMGKILQGRTEDELARQAGILGKTVRNNAQKAHAIVNGSFHNGKFSDRIWQYQDLMREDLGKLLQQGLIQGKGARALAKDLRKYWYGNDPKTGGGITYCTERLMRTELARVQTEAQKQSFERNGFDKYMFIVNGGCCPICEGVAKKNDGIYAVAKMMPGENAPPMHPNCRCSTAAYEDSEEYEAWLDYLEQGGTTEEWNKLKIDKIIRFAAATNIAEAKDFAENVLGVEQVNEFDEDMSLEVANGVNEAIFKISNDFGSLTEYGYLNKIVVSDVVEDSYAQYFRNTATMSLNNAVRRKDAMSILAADAQIEFEMGGWSTGSPLHSVYHELGHAAYYMLTDGKPELIDKINSVYSKKYSDILGSDTEWVADKEQAKELAKKAKEAGFSYYGLRNPREFVSEAFAQYYCTDNPSEITKSIIDLLLEG